METLDYDGLVDLLRQTGIQKAALLSALREIAADAPAANPTYPDLSIAGSNTDDVFEEGLRYGRDAIAWAHAETARAAIRAAEGEAQR